MKLARVRATMEESEIHILKTTLGRILYHRPNVVLSMHAHHFHEFVAFRFAAAMRNEPSSRNWSTMVIIFLHCGRPVAVFTHVDPNAHTGRQFIRGFGIFMIITSCANLYWDLVVQNVTYMVCGDHIAGFA